MRIAGPSPRRLAERVPLTWVSWPIAAALSLAAVGAAAMLRMALQPVLPPGYPFITFFPVVILAAFLFGPRIGAMAGVSGGLLAWYGFIPPDGFAINPGTAIALGFYMFIIATDIAVIHWMQRATAQLVIERETSARLADTSELLFRELQHRVSNNLQMVGGLLALQKREVADPAARHVLDEASRRLGLIGRISRQLYDPRGAGRDMLGFLDALAGDVIDASGRSGIAHRVEGKVEVEVAPESAIPLALAVAEALANAIEHGFANRDHGVVTLRLASADDRILVEVEDDGNGLANDFKPAAGSLGLRIATLLTGQLGGSFALDRAVQGGAIARIDLPLSSLLARRE